MNAIVISLGGLNVAYLGCYGNGWIDTPHLDRLAAEGFVFDECFAECPAPEASRRAWWTGQHQFIASRFAPDRALTGHDSLPALLRTNGVTAVLVRDLAGLGSESAVESAGFDQLIATERRPESPSGRVFDAAVQWLDSRDTEQPFLLFLDCHGAHPPWQPSADFIARTCEASQDATTETITSRQLYAATVSHLDAQLGTFLDYLRCETLWRQSLVLITSDAGELVREHGSTGGEQPTLHEEQWHVPLFVHLPGVADPATRSHALAQAVDLMPTVLDLFGVAVPPTVHGTSLLPVIRGDRTRVRDHAIMGDARGARAVRSSAWHLISPPAVAAEGASSGPGLYAKPDDRWDQNNIARQSPDVVEHLREVLFRFDPSSERPS